VNNKSGDLARNGFFTAQSSSRRRILSGIEQIPYFSSRGACLGITIPFLPFSDFLW
jgi:hypothetical protein